MTRLQVASRVPDALAAKYRAEGWWDDRRLADGLEAAANETGRARRRRQRARAHLRRARRAGERRRCGVGRARCRDERGRRARDGKHGRRRGRLPRVAASRGDGGRSSTVGAARPTSASRSRCSAMRPSSSFRPPNRIASPPTSVIAPSHCSKRSPTPTAGTDRALDGARPRRAAGDPVHVGYDAAIRRVSCTPSTRVTAGANNMARITGADEHDVLFLVSPAMSSAGITQMHLTADRHAALVLEDRFEPVASLERLNAGGRHAAGRRTGDRRAAPARGRRRARNVTSRSARSRSAVPCSRGPCSSRQPTRSGSRSRACTARRRRRAQPAAFPRTIASIASPTTAC